MPGRHRRGYRRGGGRLPRHVDRADDHNLADLAPGEAQLALGARPHAGAGLWHRAGRIAGLHGYIAISLGPAAGQRPGRAGSPNGALLPLVAGAADSMMRLVPPQFRRQTAQFSLAGAARTARPKAPFAPTAFPAPKPAAAGSPPTHAPGGPGSGSTSYFQQSRHRVQGTRPGRPPPLPLEGGRVGVGVSDACERRGSRCCTLISASRRQGGTERVKTVKQPRQRRRDPI